MAHNLFINLCDHAIKQSYNKRTNKDLNKNTTTGGEIKRTGGLDRPSAELMTNSTACTYVVAADSTDLAASGVSTKTLESNPAEERRCQRRRFIYFPKCFLAGGHQQLASM